MRTLAAFDFDGTLTERDTLLPFLIYEKGAIPFACHLFKTLPSLVMTAGHPQWRQKVKEAVLKSTLGGLSCHYCREKGEAFALQLSHLIKPKALARLKWHQAQGHETVLISANLTLYLEPWGKKEGFSHIIASQLEQHEGLITGNLLGLNCWGEEKVRRLLAWAGPKENFTLWAYGDTYGGDGPLLKLADYPFFRHF